MPDEYFATGYTREDLKAMHPDIELEPEYVKCPQCYRENSKETWARFGGKCPNCLDLFDKQSGIVGECSGGLESSSGARRLAIRARDQPLRLHQLQTQHNGQEPRQVRATLREAGHEMKKWLHETWRLYLWYVTFGVRGEKSDPQ